jgi:hypothetical protein
MILEAVTLITTANAAIGAVKEFIQNGRDLCDAGDHLATYFDTKAKIQEKANKNGYKSDLEAFRALEKLKQQEAELKEMMIYSGRGGMWDDWLQFQVEQKRQRVAAEEMAARVKRERRRKIREWMLAVVIVVTTLAGIGIIIGVIWLAKNRGLT